MRNAVLCLLCFLLGIKSIPLRSQTIPQLDWGTYLGGTANESCRDLILDPDGNIYLIGSARSTNAVATSGTHQSFLAGNFDAFVAKFNNEGVLQWSSYFGGSSNEFGQNIDIDVQGNVYITGVTSSTDGIATAGAAQGTFAGGTNDGFVAKFTNTGILVWATYLGGVQDEFSNAVAVDGSGNVYVSGWTNSIGGMTTPGAHQENFSGQQDAFLFKYDGNGGLQWATYFGGSGFDIGLQLETDAGGNVLMSGWTSSLTNIATVGTHQPVYGGGTADAFLTLFSADGVQQWGTYYGGSGDDYGDALRLDEAGNIYLAGPCSSSGAIATSGTHQTAIGAGFDAFLVKFAPGAVRQWGTYFGGNRDDTAYGIATGRNGNVYLTGFTNSDSGIATADAHQTNFAGGNWDAYLVKFSADGVREWGSYYGGEESDQSYGIGVDAMSGVLLAGTTSSSQNISAGGVHQPLIGGSDDAFLARFSACSDPILDVPNGGYLCSNQAFVLELNFSAAGPYTFIYTIDGVEQPPVTTPVDSFQLVIDSGSYQDSVVITEVSSEGCIGQITGLPYIKVVEPLAATAPVLVCDEDAQTYTVGVQLSGGMFDYVPIDPVGGAVNGNIFTSSDLPFGQNYRFQLTSGLGCDTLTIAGMPVACGSTCPDLDLSATSNAPICEGDTLQLMVSGDADSFSWSGPANFSSTDQNPSVANVARARSGIYRVMATNPDGCLDTSSVTVVINPPPAIIDLDIPPLTCTENTSTITVEASGNGQLEYSLGGVNFGPDNTFPDLTAGSYSLYIRDETTCVNRSNFLLNPANGPIVNRLEVVAPDCGETNGMILITAQGDQMPFEYSIDGGQTFQDSGEFAGLGGGDYPIIVRDQSGCTTTASAGLAGGEDPPVIDEVLIEQAACAVDQNSITVNAVSGSDELLYSINGTDFRPENRFTDLLPGSYELTVEDENGCAVTESVTIPAINVLTLDEIAIRPADCRGNSGRVEVTARGGSGILQYQLDTIRQTTPVFSGLSPGTYQLTVTDGSGCAFSEQVHIASGDCPIYIANAFSPNGDGVNDRFSVLAAAGIDGQVVRFLIFNRWGNLVYEAGTYALGDPAQGWDGTIQGRAAAMGAYVYYLVIELNGGEKIVEKGEVNLLR